MKNFWGWFSKKRSGEAEDRDVEVEYLRLNFKARYHSFKLLISANNKSLENMADIERALLGKEVFGMGFIKARVTAIAVSVFSMISHLKTITGGKYSELEPSFFRIEQEIAKILSPKKNAEDPRLVIPFKDVEPGMAYLVGEKMDHAAEVKNKLGLIVPEGFAITATAYELFMRENKLQSEIERIIQSAGPDSKGPFDILSSRIRSLILDSKIPDELEKAVREEWEKLEQAKGAKVRLALRSSAMGEDSMANSFAGQYRSELNVSWDGVFDAYKEVVASKYSVKAISYKLNRGVRDEDIAMCVGCMEMVDAVAGGVAYSRNPVDADDESVYINAALGLPKSVVDGQDTCDLFVVSRAVDYDVMPARLYDKEPLDFIMVTQKEPTLTIRSDVREKQYQVSCLENEGVHRAEVQVDMRKEPALSDEKIRELFWLVIQIENYYKCPQDIEWALDRDGRLFILQCRPLKQTPFRDPAKDEAVDPRVTPIVNAGITASPGAGCGEVYHVSKRADILQFPEGAVLVVEQASPAWASLINRASAVVSEQGSFAGHLANVAREFHVPALFAVKDAMKLLNQGDTVTVDADSMIVYPGKIDELLQRKVRDRNLMDGSPVFETLKSVSEHIVHLHLLNPESKDFIPENCTTYHDITRFIHEKSVNEMFQFGKENHFTERSSKQLHYVVPMKWWILNLDDGFSQEVQGKYVKIEHIVSIPMLAFWKGFTAIPWDGPPPLDGKGFAAVMFQSTAQPALVTSMPSKFADRNYFMLSKNYCSLNSRLGYHFATMEALVGDRAGENYVNFQFKGGAADFERKMKRVYFIGDLLERYGFRVDVRQDNLSARLEGYDREYMEKRLQVLGYLTLHTRQLDMIMTNSSRVIYYREKMIKDIDKLLAA